MKAVLFIHGLSAKVEDNKYFIDEMKKMPNIKIYSFILPGHENDMVKRVKYNEWINKAESELKEILKNHKKVTIVSHSMGTIIATNLASRYKEVDKLVLISPAFLFGNLEQNKKDLKNLLNNNVDDNIGTGFEGALTKFFEIPKSVWIQYRKMARDNISNIAKIKCQTLIISGNCDNLISMKAVQYVYDKLKCKKDLVIVDNVRHQVFKSHKKDVITMYIYKFIAFNFLYKISKRRTI